MKALLVDGFTDAYRGLGAALRLFWPVLVTILLICLARLLLRIFVGSSNTDESPTALISSVLVTFCVAAYLFLILCHGAVGWHRKLLLNEAPGWISPIPRQRAFQYALAVFVFALIYLMGHMLISYYSLPYLHSVFTSSVQDIDFTDPTGEQLETWRQAVWPIQIATFATTVAVISAILWFGRSWLLVFPHVSIRASKSAFGLIKESLNPPTGLVGAVLVAFFLPSFVGLIYDLVMPVKMQLLRWLAMSSSIAQLATWAFCFLWGLSILSNAYVKAAAGKVPFERIGDAEG